VIADSESNFYVLDIPDCSNASVVQSVTVLTWEVGTLTIDTEPGEVVHLWAGSANFSNPGGGDNEYAYHMEIDGIVSFSSVETATWSAVKSLYR